MVTERRYKNALVVIEQYKKEQEELRQLSLQKEGITLDADIHELNSKGLVSDRLTYKLYQLWNWERAWNSNPKDFTLNLFTDLTNTEFSNHRGVGKKTLDEFVKLMAAAGHTVL